MTDAPFALPTSLTVARRLRFYDAFAFLYDFVVGSQLYHRYVWGMDPGEHARFTRRALESSTSSAVLDGGCGSLLFTARCYQEARQPLTLLDASTSMLERGRRRLKARQSDVRFVQGDLYGLPFESGSFGSVHHFGVLHCLDHPARALSEFRRVLVPGGRLFLSSLVLGRARGDAMLSRLSRAGHVASPRTASEVGALVESGAFCVNRSVQLGSFVFLEATARGTGTSHHHP